MSGNAPCPLSMNAFAARGKSPHPVPQQFINTLLQK